MSLLLLLSEEGEGIVFLPTNLSGLQVWLDASDATTITQVANAVSQWDDKSSNANHALQATGSAQPITNSRTQNSKNVLDFDGTTDVMQTAAFTALTQPNTIFAVAKYDGILGDYLTDGIATSNRHAIFEANGKISLYAGAELNTATNDIVAHIYAAEFNSTSSILYQDGVSVGIGDAGTNTLTGLTIGGRFTGISDFLDGWLAEIIVYDRLLTFTERQQVESYLSDKWGITTVTNEPFSLAGWKLTLPVDSAGNLSGSAHEILQPTLLAYASEWFIRGNTFQYICPDGGATTSTATFARTELRHLTDFSWNQATEDKIIFSVDNIGVGEKTIVFQTHDSSDPEFKVIYTGSTTGTGLLRILYKATFGAPDTTVVFRSDLSDGDIVKLRIKRSTSELQAFWDANVDGTVPDWTSNSDVPFSRQSGSRTYFWKRGNYYQIENGPPYDGTPTSTVSHYTGSNDNPIDNGADAANSVRMETSSKKNSSTGTIVVTAPASIVDDDLLLLFVSSDHSGTGDTVYTAPTGFTALTTYTRVNTGAAGVSGQVFYKKAASESGNYTITETALVNSSAIMLRISGANTVTPFDVDAEGSNIASDPATAPTVTTTGTNRLVVRAATWDQSKSLSVPPVGVSEAEHQDVSGHDLWVGDEFQAVAGATGTALWDLSAGTRWLAYTIAVKG